MMDGVIFSKPEGALMFSRLQSAAVIAVVLPPSDIPTSMCDTGQARDLRFDSATH